MFQIICSQESSCEIDVIIIRANNQWAAERCQCHILLRHVADRFQGPQVLADCSREKTLRPQARRRAVCTCYKVIAQYSITYRQSGSLLEPEDQLRPPGQAASLVSYAHPCPMKGVSPPAM